MKKRYLKLVRSAFRSLRHPHLRHRRWWQSLTRPVANRQLWIPCRDTVANGMAIGLFFSMIPISVLQMILSSLLAMRAKANIPFTVAACWVSNPVTTIPLIWLQCMIGDWIRHSLGVPMPDWLAHHGIHVPEVGMLNAASFLLGVSTTAVLAALSAYPIVHAFSALMPHHLPVRRKRAVDCQTASPDQ